MDLDTYVRIFNQSNVSADKFKPTKCWSIKELNSLPHSTMNDLYLANVRNYSSTSLVAAKKYQYKELKIIENKVNWMMQKSQTISSYNGYELVFNKREPKLGFTKKTSKPRDETCSTHSQKESQYLLLKTMICYGLDNNLFGKTKGSHLCLYINRLHNGVTYGPEPPSFLHIGADLYFDLHPDALAFYISFMANNEYNILT